MKKIMQQQNTQYNPVFALSPEKKQIEFLAYVKDVREERDILSRAIAFCVANNIPLITDDIDIFSAYGEWEV
ncbi:MAG: hypothetical protein Q9M37_05935 [Desulfonauticus sp.]|nr:hypothetical protein [Desulfonauticus sp.]